jgi:hypothetical protein
MYAIPCSSHRSRQLMNAPTNAIVTANPGCRTISDMFPTCKGGRIDVTRLYSSSSSIGISALQRQHQSVFIASNVILMACPGEDSVTVVTSPLHGHVPLDCFSPDQCREKIDLYLSQ